MPDRLVILPDGLGVFFVEFKRLGEKLTPAQTVEIEKIRAQGTTVLVLDSVLLGKQAVDLALLF